MMEEYKWTAEDWKINYEDCWGFTEKGDIIQALEFTGEEENLRVMCEDADGKVGQLHPHTLSFPAIPVGYVNTDAGAFLLTRRLYMQWRRGMCCANTHLIDPTTSVKMKYIHGGDTDVRTKFYPDVTRENVKFLLEPNKNYPTLTEALNIIKSGKLLSVAIDALTALSLDLQLNIVIYQGKMVVGYIAEDGTPTMLYNLTLGDSDGTT